MDGYRFLICLVAAITYCSSDPDPLDTLTINLNLDGSQRSTIPPTPTPPPTDYNCTCGIKNPKIDQESRILGGNNTGIFEYPWMVSIKTKDKGVPDEEYKHHCGGVLVASQWVLTAAHCIDDWYWKDILVFLGEHDQTTADETDKTIIYKTKKFIMHPDNLIFNNDIGLIKLDGSADLNIYTPACLSEANQFFTGMKGTVTGWGENGTYDIHPDQLQFLHATVGSDEYCQEHDPRGPDYSNMTAGVTCSSQLGETGKGECYGDSGGPLTVEYFGRHYLVGLVHGPAVSTFLYCGDGSIMVYASAAKLRNWIDQTIEENEGAAYCTPTPFPFDKDEE